MRELASQSTSDSAPASKQAKAPAPPVPVSPWFVQPKTASSEPLLQRKCACGGDCPTCQESAAPEAVQTKLAVSSPGDQYEREADHVADQIMRMAAPGDGAIQKIDGAAAPQLGQRGCYTFAGGEEEEPQSQTPVQRKERGTSPVSGGVNAQPHLAELRSGGQPLPATSRNFFEPRFGYDFGDVRIHSNDQAATLARSVNARAYTLGRDIVFDSDQYSPNTQEGQRLLAHELTHVVQQGKGGSGEAQRVLRSPHKGESPAQQIPISAMSRSNQATLQRKLGVGGPSATALVGMLNSCSSTGGIQLSSTPCPGCPSGFNTVDQLTGVPASDPLSMTLWDAVSSTTATGCWRGVSNAGSVFLDQFDTRSFDVGDLANLPAGVPSGFPSAFTRCEDVTHIAVEFWNGDKTGAAFGPSHALGLAAQDTFRAAHGIPGTMVRQVLVSNGHGVHEYSNGAKTHVFFAGGNVTSVTHEN